MDRKIKVIHVLHSLGGVDIYLRLLTENCNPDLIENVIVNGTNNKKYFDKHQKQLNQYLIRLKRNISIINDFNCIFQTIKILKKEKPNLIHGHSAKGGIIARIASLFYPIKVLHTPHAYSYLSSTSKVKRFIFLTIERVFKNFNSILLATSDSELNRGIKEVGYPSSRALLFNNSILPIEIENITETEFSLPQNFICTVGRPSYQKNIEMMIEVVKNVKEKIPDIHLVVMGLGVVSPNTENVKSLISKYDLEKNVTLIEWIEREKIFHIIKKSKFYISTARYEGLPYAIIESLSLAKAVIATNCDGNRDLVKNNYNGYLIEPNQLDLFTEKCIELYGNNKVRQNFENNSYLLFKEKFDLSVNIKILEEIYFNYT